MPATRFLPINMDDYGFKLSPLTDLASPFCSKYPSIFYGSAPGHHQNPADHDGRGIHIPAKKYGCVLQVNRTLNRQAGVDFYPYLSIFSSTRGEAGAYLLLERKEEEPK
jgi:hypothetical protein